MLEPVIRSAQQLEFQDLMLHRVYEILLVASPYDAFILEEDGRLTEQILTEYLGMNFNYPPRVWTANTAARGLKIVTKRKFDLVIVMSRIADMSPVTFGQKIKELYPRKPVVMLAFDESEYKHIPNFTLHDNPAIDKVFIWSGHANVLLAIIKYIEDQQNARRDILRGDVRAIIFIEDTPRYYSFILPVIYQEVMYNTQQLVSKSLNTTDRLLHLRARPKILLTSTYEEAKKYFKEYGDHLLGIVSDIRFPKKGELLKDAGILFSKYVREKDPTMPIMLQSTEGKNAKKAEKVNAAFLHKRSNTLPQDIRTFMHNNFGFGDFVFRYPNGKEIARVSTIAELLDILPDIPDESIKFHANSNHFSNWLAARGEFPLASHIRPLSDSDFETQDDRRNYYIRLITKYQEMEQSESVAEMSSSSDPLSSHFNRIAEGSMGGKARGLAFVNSILRKSKIHEKFPGIDIRIPRVWVAGTDEFDTFMRENKLWDKALKSKSNKTIRRHFLQAEFSESFLATLKNLITEVQFPLAVRSSSILEDSQYQPLSGMYATYMLPNNHPNDDVRLTQLCDAIKLVYASAYYDEPKAFIDASIHRHEEEKMGVIIMELVGQHYNGRYYPTLSGTVQSINYYPVSYLKREDGIATIALGFGRTVVDGERALRFSPAYPKIIPQFYSVRATLESSQNRFYALNLALDRDPLKEGEEENLSSFDLNHAETDGALKWAGSTLSVQDNVIRDSMFHEGARVVTFAPMLKGTRFPLADILKDLLKLGKKSLGTPVELEFAVNLYEEKEKRPEFCLLQIKPIAISTLEEIEDQTHISEEDILCRSTIALGNGKIEGIRHAIIVHPDKFDSAKTRDIAREIAAYNDRLSPEFAYILVGPGRWGTADPWLGIPVNWDQISGAKVIVEMGLENFPIDPSFGSHFFQNVTSMRVGYFTINHKEKRDFINLEWFVDHKVLKKKQFTSLIEMEEPVVVNIEGQSGEGAILKPLIPEEEVMDEQESSGI